MFSLGIAGKAFLSIMLTLDTWIYSLVSSSYKIFMAIASARILNADAYTAVSKKVYVIVGVAMLFVLAYAIMKAIVDPDQMSKGDMAGGKILKSIAVAVIGLIITPLIFDFAFMAQGKLLEDDILGKLFFRTNESDTKVGSFVFNPDEELKNTGGAVAAVSVWQAFFYPEEGVDPETLIADPDVIENFVNTTAVSCAGLAALAIGGFVAGWFSGGVAWVIAGGAVASCALSMYGEALGEDLEDHGEVNLVEAYAMASSGYTFGVFQGFIDAVDEGDIRYTWFISTVCGAFVAYAFVSYSIDMGLRAAKLAYYQIIAPVPLILGVLPKNGDRVGKFVKAVFSTFLEVFVRISVVYIVVYIIAHLNSLFSTTGALWDSTNLTSAESLIAMALIIIGLVLFAKQAPKIISDTFGLSAGAGLDGLNIMKKLRDGEVFTAGTIAGSALKSGVQNVSRSWKKNEGKGLTRKVAGAAGSFVGGAASGTIRSGIGRARSHKPVGGVHEMRDHVDRTARDLHDKRQNRDDFNRVNDTMDKKINSIKGMASARIQTWATGDIDTGSIDRQSAAFDYVRDVSGKLEGTVGNDPAIKEANRYVADLASYNADTIYAKMVRERYDKLAVDPRFASITDPDAKDRAIADQVAQDLGFNKGDSEAIRTISELHRYSDRSVSLDELNAARDAADDRLKTAKKDAVSRKLAEAHLSGVDNDTSRMAKQLLSSREFLKYAGEFDNLTFYYDEDQGREITFGEYLRSSFGDNVTRNGELDLGRMFETQTKSKDLGGTAGAPYMNIKFKSTNVTDRQLGIGDTGVNIDMADLDVIYDLKEGEIRFNHGGSEHRVKLEHLKKMQIPGQPEGQYYKIEVAESDTIASYGAFDAATGEYTNKVAADTGSKKKTVFARTKDRGESEGDKFRSSEFYRSRKADAREAEKNKDKK